MAHPRESEKQDNLFEFRCPATADVARYADCLDLNYHFMRGNGLGKGNPVCLASMEAGKCPVRHMQEEEWMKGRAIYHALERTVGRISQEVFDRVKNIVVPESVKRKFKLTPEQIAELRAMNDRAVEVETRRAEQKVQERREATERRREKRHKKEVKRGTAPSVGIMPEEMDMAAVITEAVANEMRQPKMSLLERAKMMKGGAK